MTPESLMMYGAALGLGLASIGLGSMLCALAYSMYKTTKDQFKDKK